MSRTNPFNAKVVFGLIAAGIVAFAALLFLLAYGSSLGTSRDGRAHAQSVAATGYKGLFDLVGMFREAHLVRDHDRLFDHLLVLSIEPQTSAEDLSRLLSNRTNYPTLLILPKWMTLPDPRRRGWVRPLGTGVPIRALSALGADVRITSARNEGGRTARGTSPLQGLTIPVPASAQLIEGGELIPVVALDRGALVARIGDRPHYVVADPDLMNNQGLRDPATARAALTLIDALNVGDPASVDFDLTLNGLGDEGSPNLLQLAFEPPFLAMTLALVFAALLAGLHGVFRFGPEQPEARAIALGKAALVENSAGLIRLARREARLGGAYAEVLRQETARAVNAPAWLQGEALDAYLDRMTKSGEPFSVLAQRLVTAGDRASLMAAARALYQWKKDLIP